MDRLCTLQQKSMGLIAEAQRCSQNIVGKMSIGKSKYLGRLPTKSRDIKLSEILMLRKGPVLMAALEFFDYCCLKTAYWLQKFFNDRPTTGINDQGLREPKLLLFLSQRKQRTFPRVIASFSCCQKLLDTLLHNRVGSLKGQTIFVVAAVAPSSSFDYLY